MPGTNFFTELGLFVCQEFFSLKSCRELVDEIRCGTHQPATVVGAFSIGNYVADNYRRTLCAQISPALSSQIYAQVLAIKPQLEKHFSLSLTAIEQLEFLQYRKGDFFIRHQDCDDDPHKPMRVRIRRVSVTILLNDSDTITQPGDYSGGSLNFYGLLQEPLWEKCGFPLHVRAGTLVAFLSTTEHEVSVVERGERHSVAGWFY